MDILSPRHECFPTPQIVKHAQSNFVLPIIFEAFSPMAKSNFGKVGHIVVFQAE